MDFANLRHRTIVFILILFTFIIYANSLMSSFVWDDFVVIVDNSFIKSWKNITLIFSKNYLTSAPAMKYLHSNRLDSGELSYRPLVTISYFIDYFIWKLNPLGYHLTNIIFHISNVILLYFLIYLVAKNKQISLLASLLFALHPINVEAVNCISFREDLLAFLFFISSLILFIKLSNLDGRKRIYCQIVSLVLYSLALFSKEMAITFPLVIILYDYYFTYEQNIKKIFTKLKSRYLGYIVVSLFYLWVLFFYMADRQRVSPQYPGGNFYTNFLAISNVVAIYIKSLFLPINIYGTVPSLYFDPSFSGPSLFSPAFLFSLFLILLCLAVAVKIRRILPIISFSILWFFITLIPVYNIIPLDNIMAWRYLYIPAVGFCLLVAFLVFRFKRIRKDIIIVFLVFYSIFTIIGNMFWANTITLWLETQRHYPNNALVYNNIGFGYGSIGKDEKAIGFFNKAIEIKPDYALAYYNLGLSYARINKIEEAISSYEKAIEIYNDFTQAYQDLACIYLKYKGLGKIEESMLLYKKATEIYPDFSEAHNNLGVAYMETGRIEEAISSFQKAIEINPKYAGAYYNLALAYREKSEDDLANSCYDKARGLGFDSSYLLEPFISRRENELSD